MLRVLGAAAFAAACCAPAAADVVMFDHVDAGGAATPPDFSYYWTGPYFFYTNGVLEHGQVTGTLFYIRPDQFSWLRELVSIDIVGSGELDLAVGRPDFYTFSHRSISLSGGRIDFDPPVRGWGYLLTSPQPFTISRVTFTDMVPEPGAWAMMLAGFGTIGFAGRRRRIVTA